MSGTRRFQLRTADGVEAQYDTWEEAESAFSHGVVTKMIPRGFYLTDSETGRCWLPGADYRWEAAQT
jgi:hypothetical protein